MKLLLFLLFIFFVGGIGYYFAWPMASQNAHLANGVTDSDVIALADSDVPDPFPSDVPMASTGAELHRQIEQIASESSDIRIGVSAFDVKGGLNLSYRGGESHIAASTTKLIAAMHFLSQVENGKAHLDQKMGAYTAEYQLGQMVNQSNNDSWSMFNAFLGLGQEENYSQSLGLIGFNSSNNSITSDDMVLLLRKLYLGEALNKEHTEYLLSLMQDTEDDSFVPKTDTEYMIRHKNGKYETDVNEAVIVTKGDVTRVIAVYTDGNDAWEYDKRRELIQKIITALLP